MAKITSQPYPRIQDVTRSDYGCLDDSKLKPHHHKMSPEDFKQLVRHAILKANAKSGRESLNIPIGAGPEEIELAYEKAGKELFRYFWKYCGDPAATAHQVYNRHYKEVAREQFRNRTLQKERMNSGWRYQYLSVDAARASQRFLSISDIGAAEGDFNAVVETIDGDTRINLYVSVKNRSNTMGGQDWPKAIRALETLAAGDKNKSGPYCCVFGIAMEKGGRYIKRDKRSGMPHGPNTEIWLSDFFWPFFANFTYEEVMRLVLEVLISDEKQDEFAGQIAVPEPVVEAFGRECRRFELIDLNSRFHDPYRLVHFFVNDLGQSRKMN